MTEQRPTPASTRYYRRGLLYCLNALQVWAAWKKARLTGADLPTLEAIFGSTDRVVRTWRNNRTGEMVVSVECPRGNHWERVTEYEITVPNSSGKLLGIVEVTGLAVDEILRRHVSLQHREELLQALPITGCYSLHEFDMDSTQLDDLLERISKSAAWRSASRSLREYAIIGPRKSGTTFTLERSGQSAFAS